MKTLKIHWNNYNNQSKSPLMEGYLDPKTFIFTPDAKFADKTSWKSGIKYGKIVLV